MKKSGILMGCVFLCFLMVASAAAGTGTVTSKGADFQIYGKTKMEVNYDTVRFTKYNDFLGVVANDQDWKNDSTNFNPRDTRLGAVGTFVQDDWTAKGHLEIDFYGDNNGNNLIPRMRHGYVSIKNKGCGTELVMGQTWIPISKLFPSTIDFGVLSAGGNLWWRVPQVTVNQTIMDDVTLTLSAMQHRRINTDTNERMPWVMGRTAYALEGDPVKGLVAIGGGYRDTNDVERWVVCGEMKMTYKIVTFKSEVWTGSGVGGHFLRYDLDTNDLNEPIDAFGTWADVTVKVMPDLSVTAGYGMDNPKDKHLFDDQRTAMQLNDREFTLNQVIYGNCWYTIMTGVKIGLEVMHIETERGTTTNAGNRFTMSTMINF